MRLSVAALVLIAGAAMQAQTVISFRVSEQAGIRRTAFPVSARIPFSGGKPPDPAHVRLTLSGKEVPAQYLAEPGALDVDFNASIGPLETQTYQLEYGPGVVSGPAPPRGLPVSEEADAVQVGNVRLGKSVSPLILSVKYRSEDIGQGINGLVVSGVSSVDALKTEVMKGGPLLVVIRYTGKLVLDSGYSAPFALTVAMPNSKTMITMSVSIEDPLRRLREISFGTPLSLGPLPWTWDFGTSHWTYGSFRNATDSVTLTQSRGGWTVVSGPRGKEQQQETGRSEPVRWGHIQDGKEVVAFGAEAAGTTHYTMNGTGQLLFSYAPDASESHHELTVFEHFVNTPVQIGAATSPAALLNPLAVEVLP